MWQGEAQTLNGLCSSSPNVLRWNMWGVTTFNATGHQLLAYIIYSNYSPVAISLNSLVVYKTGMLDVGIQTCFPRNLGKHARNPLILPNRIYLKHDSLTSWMEKFSKFNSRDSQQWQRCYVICCISCNRYY